MPKKRLRVRLISWKEDRAAAIKERLESARFAVEAGEFESSTLKALAQDPPDAIVIDLGRLPSHGRDVGVAARTRASTRSIPLIFVEGTEDTVDRTREQLPDAVYTNLDALDKAVRRALDKPLTEPVVPSSSLAGYSGTPLPRKLGIKPGSMLALINAPSDFGSTLGVLPEGTRIRRSARPEAAVTLWFVDSMATLENGIERMAEIAGGGRLWICWPKKTSGRATDVTQNDIRARGLAAGVVDFKICAVDAIWSGLCFTRRKA